MGNKYTVSAWHYNKHSTLHDGIEHYAGESFLAALWHLAKAKRSGARYVNLEWR